MAAWLTILAMMLAVPWPAQSSVMQKLRRPKQVVAPPVEFWIPPHLMDN